MNQPTIDPQKEMQARRLQLQEQAANKQSEFLRAVLIASTSILGILIALHTKGESPLYIRLVFVAALFALTFGVLMTASALRYQTKAYADHYNKVRIKVDLARQGHIDTGRIATGNYATFQRRQNIAYTFLILGLLLLVSYATLATL